MDYLLRCSIIFVTFHIICISFGIHGINPDAQTKLDRIKTLKNKLDLVNSNQPNAWPWQQELKNPFKFLPNYDSNVDDYNRSGDGEDVDESVQYSNENTQSIDSDDEEYEEDESLFLNKRNDFLLRKGDGRGPYRSSHEDLCPYHEERYIIRNETEDINLRGKVLMVNLTEKVCNHTKTDRHYNREYNRVCHSVGKTFENGYGTHCFQRYTSKDIEYKSIRTGRKGKYTEDRFRAGCSCGWATYELGSIEDYHVGKKS